MIKILIDDNQDIDLEMYGTYKEVFVQLATLVTVVLERVILSRSEDGQIKDKKKMFKELVEKLAELQLMGLERGIVELED